MKEIDVVIMGAGPGGATAALQLAKRGISCVLIDKAVFPRDKICGDALSGKVVNELKRIDPEMHNKLAAMPIQLDSWGIDFYAPNLKKLSIPFKPNYNKAEDKTPGYICKRIDFDNFLIEEVKKSPLIELIEGMEVQSKATQDGRRIVSNADGSFAVAAKILLVANGAHSNFTRETARITVEPEHYCAGLRAYYKNVSGMDADNFIELHFLKDFLPGYFWIFPLPNGYANVGVGMLSETVSKKKVNLKKRMLEIIEEYPQLKQRFANAELVGSIKGYGLPLGSKKRVISGDNYMLIGDAAYLIDPFSGEGISNAMISGRFAAEQAEKCLLENRFDAEFMQQYDQTVYKRLWKELKLSRRMQQLLNYPWLFNMVANKASRNKTVSETISCMFNDIDLREKLKSPSFYFKLIFD